MEKPQSITDIGPNPHRSRIGRTLLFYIMASNHVVSAALVVEREEPGRHLKVQRPVYFVGVVLTDPRFSTPRCKNSYTPC